jgi:putative DNA primase/helicase
MTAPKAKQAIALINLDDARTAGMGEWPDPTEPVPLGDDLPPVPAFNSDLLPDAWRAWIMDIADRMQAPADFPAAAAVVAGGGLIGRRVGIAPQERTDWIEVPNLWGGIIGRPSVMKSPTMSAAYAPVRKLEAKAAEAHTAAIKDYDRALAVYELKKKAWSEIVKAEAKKAMKTGTEATISPFSATEPVAPIRKRFILEDTTYEKAGEIMAGNPNGIAVLCDELVGFLKPLCRQENAAARAFWLKAWNGKDMHPFDRIGRGSILTPCTASIFGGIQPARLAGFLKQALNGGDGDDGLLQRFQVLVYPDVRPDWRDVDRDPNRSARLTYSDGLEVLATLDPQTVNTEATEYDAIPFLRFCLEALRLFQDWRADHEKTLRVGDLHPALESHFAKYRKLVPALALIFHLVDCPSGGPVSAEATQRALMWADYLADHAKRIYGSVSLPERTSARVIWKKLKATGSLPDTFSIRDIQQKGWAGLGNAEAIRAALEVLLDHSLVQVRDIPTTGRGGRPGEQFRMNPKTLALT